MCYLYTGVRYIYWSFMQMFTQSDGGGMLCICKCIVCGSLHSHATDGLLTSCAAF